MDTFAPPYVHYSNLPKICPLPPPQNPRCSPGCCWCYMMLVCIVMLPPIQAYKGDKQECSLPVASYEKLTEARVRCWTVVSANGRDEQLWSPFSPKVHCQCIQESCTEGKVNEEISRESVEAKKGKTSSAALSPQMMAMTVFIVGALLTLLLAFVLGQYAI